MTRIPRININSASVLILILTALILVSGCATVKDKVVLVADADGKVGQVTVRTEGGERTLTSADTMVEVTEPALTPSEPKKMDRRVIERLFSGSMKAMPPEPVSFLLYFASNSADLADGSRAQFPEIMATARKRPFYEISIIGHTDTTGSEEYNMKLSASRAAAVRDILLSLGVAQDRIEIRYHGKHDPIIPTVDNVSEPRNRVVEVVVK